MLEKEGIVFEEEGGVDKIRKDFFVTDFGSSDTGCTSSSDGTKKRKRENQVKDDDGPSKQQQAICLSNNKSKEITEEHLKDEIIALLHKRTAGKTC